MSVKYDPYRADSLAAHFSRTENLFFTTDLAFGEDLEHNRGQTVIKIKTH